jgi:hypothetical protein
MFRGVLFCAFCMLALYVNRMSYMSWPFPYFQITLIFFYFFRT